MREKEESPFEVYIRFVQDVVDRYKGIGDVASGDEVTPQRLNAAMANFYPTCVGLLAEYQRAKTDRIRADLSFQRWWDARFLEAKTTVIREYSDDSIKGAKPSVSEYEARARRDNADEYYKHKEKMLALEEKERFLLHMFENLSKYDKILTTLSSNTRSEMYSISIDRRAMANPSQHKVRRED